MKIDIKNFNNNINRVMRELGYHPDNNSSNSFSRRLRSNKYPRFHIYIEDNILNLHLDQTAVQYDEETDHQAEYNNQIIKQEAKRIKKYVSN